MKFLGRLFLLAMLVCYASAVNISTSSYSSDGLPVANITVQIYNESGSKVFENVTNVLGNVTAYDLGGESFYIRHDYPSSAYSARIDYINGSRRVFLNDIFGATLRLVNTLGQSLEGQDCSVAIYRNDTNTLVKDYDTTCRQGEKYIDTSGNWATVTDCPLTNSYGIYHFYTKITQEDGYEYGRYYTARITCNAKTEGVTFYVDVPKPVDVEAYTDTTVRYAGYIFLLFIFAIVGLLFLVIIIGVVLFLWKFFSRVRKQ